MHHAVTVLPHGRLLLTKLGQLLSEQNTTSMLCGAARGAGPEFGALLYHMKL